MRGKCELVPDVITTDAKVWRINSEDQRWETCSLGPPHQGSCHLPMRGEDKGRQEGVIMGVRMGTVWTGGLNMEKCCHPWGGGGWKVIIYQTLARVKWWWPVLVDVELKEAQCVWSCSGYLLYAGCGNGAQGERSTNPSCSCRKWCYYIYF